MNKKENIFKTLFVVILVVTLAVAVGINKDISETKSVVLNDGELIQCFNTKAVTVDQVLKEKNINVNNYDIVTPALSTEIVKEQSIDIKRAKKVFIAVDGQEKEIYTNKDTIKALLDSENINMDKDDIINYDLDTSIDKEMKIKITRVKVIEEVVEEKIPYEIKEVANSDMTSGMNKVITKGVEGVKVKKYLVKYNDGEEVHRSFISQENVREPVDEVVEFGTVRNLKTSRGEVLRYTKVLDMRATAYDLSVESCGKEPDDPLYGITYTGMKAKHGVVAVDPNTIPLYSRLYIEAADGSWTYGKAVAGDIGGAVKGNIIDLFYEDTEFVKKFGYKNVKVYILK